MKFLILFIAFTNLSAFAGDRTIVCNVANIYKENETFVLPNNECAPLNDLTKSVTAHLLDEKAKELKNKQSECKQISILKASKKKQCKEDLIDLEKEAKQLQWDIKDSDLFFLCRADRDKIYIKKTDIGPNYISNIILERFDLFEKTQKLDIGFSVSGHKEGYPLYEELELPATGSDKNNMNVNCDFRE